MDKLNPIQKTLVALLVAAMALSVVIPLLFFLTVSFSSATELSQFPKSLFPDTTVKVYVEPAEDGAYELFYDKGDGDGYSSVMTTNDADKLEKHFARQYAVSIDGEKLLEDFAQTRENGGMEFTYHKDMAYNFKQFFSIIPKAGASLTSWRGQGSEGWKM